ncbi:hypothetical protein PROSTU_03450 [Providencia stuartii ATCC 25827]|uniref:Uncharacterized protein n=1 Tax=Providencia stuartii ATCC 25827 TaxID=471874 RepID=A0AA86YX87_PROST|nr:hypothetical protein PROSTU_03450 [Providencia stuartii ATCC 25827]
MIHNLLNNSNQQLNADRRVFLAFTFLSLFTSSRSYYHLPSTPLAISQ